MKFFVLPTLTLYVIFIGTVKFQETIDCFERPMNDWMTDDIFGTESSSS